MTHRHTSTMASIRAHALAAELGVPTRIVLADLAANGEVLRSASSIIPERAVAGVRLRLSRTERDDRPPAQRQQTPSFNPWMDEFAPEDDVEPLTARGAAVLGLTPATVRQWASRGHITKVGQQGRSALYDRADLRAAKSRLGNRNPLTSRLAHNPGAKHDDELISVALAAVIAGVSPSTIRSWITRGRLPSAGRVGRAHRITVCALRGAVQRGAVGTD